MSDYSKHLNTVEIDQWFWSLGKNNVASLPKAQTVQEYAQSVPENFKFSVKVPNSITLTHLYNRNKNTPLVENPHFLSHSLFSAFIETLKPMWSKLGPIMFQFEYLNKQKIPAFEIFIERLAQFFTQLPTDFQYGIETRNPNYINQKYFQFLNSQNLHHVFLQGYYMPSIFQIFRNYQGYIKDLTVVRLHGPDRKGMEQKTKSVWNKIIAPQDDDLKELTNMLQILFNKNVAVYLNVNNHYEGSAPMTIKRINSLLK